MSVLFRVSLVLAMLCAWSSVAEAVFADESREGLLSARLELAGENRAELERALAEVPENQRRGMEYLLSHMPESDLTSLDAEFLLENCRLAYLAWEESPWAEQIPEEVFLDNLLPYANVNERRDRWRRDFYERFKPLVADAKTPSEAAVMLNQKVFKLLDVRYSTQRKKADQSPSESIESGLASCTGLSILLADACRAVGVPARLAGTPLWSDRSGNHTWVEIYDGGWHFTGACEPTGDRLDQGWFIERASKAQKDHRLHAIYAVSFKDNGQSFPLVWAREHRDVHAVNVTDRYVERARQVPEGHGVLRLKAVSERSGERGRVPFQVQLESGEVLAEGTTNDERFDTNDHASVVLKMGSKVKVRYGEGESSRVIEAVLDEREHLLVLPID